MPKRISGWVLLAVISMTVFPSETSAQTRQEFLERALTKLDSVEARHERFVSRYGMEAFRFDTTDPHLLGLARISEDGRPIVRQLLDDGANTAVRADSVHPGGGSGLALSGDSVYVGIWDTPYPRLTHIDFDDGQGGSRIDTLGVNRDPFSKVGYHWHTTYVTSIAASGAVSSTRKGVAFESLVLAHDDTLDLIEMDAAAAEFGLRVSNHSYGPRNGWGGMVMPDGVNKLPAWWGDTTVSKIEDYHRGFYDEESEDWDAFAASHPDYLIVLAAGNDRNPAQALPEDSLHWFFSGCDSGPNCHSGWSMSTEFRYSDDEPDGFDSILGGMQSAKNPLSVGALHNFEPCTTGGVTVLTPELAMSYYSSWGPVDDGRIKPDLVAPGSNLSIAGSAQDDGEGCTGSGTSFSAPLVTGSAALLLEQGGDVIEHASTLKAILLHTATDSGNVGPDYRFGFGLLNTTAAAELLQTDLQAGTDFFIHEDTLSDDDTLRYVFETDGSHPFRATLSWTDPAGTPVSDLIPKGPPWLDNRTPLLVNDLDVRVINREDSVWYPWTLDPDIPSAPAVRSKKNDVDNVEQVLTDTLAAGVYLVEITNSGILSGDQVFSLVRSGQTTVVELELKALLEGAFDSGMMSVPASFSDAVPAVQPYDSSVFSGTPLEHTGTEWLPGKFSQLIDWVVVTVRTGMAASTEVARRVGLLLEDGNIVDLDGGPLQIVTGGADSVYVTVGHRHHADVMSSSKIDVSSGRASWDFTTALTQAYTTGPSPMKNMGGSFALFAGDGGADGLITTPDFTEWLSATRSGAVGYQQTDFDMDGNVTATDFLIWLSNTRGGFGSEVPD